ncbi:dipicolinate synthase subunit B [Lachnospiraceae bacterium KM106-2]|nr:dipicolinate synthase subunit B [Lachnospiraceae bacterium KM106-2]
MNLEGTTIGFALTGSFCTFSTVFKEMEVLSQTGAKIIPIFSNSAQTIDSRFGKSKDFVTRAKEITGTDPILTIGQAEPIGPKKLLDLLLIAPCTGNTTAKLANAITDTPVTMAAKAHMRNERPVVIALSSNDSLAMNMKNIGLLLNCHHIYFVPFGQDNFKSKPASLVAHMDLILPTIENALEGKQIQPIIKDF